MLRFKQFSGSGPELERAINTWLEEYEPDVTQMAQTEGRDGRVIISFVFEESFRGQELRLSSERGMSGAPPPVIPPEVMPDEPLKVESPGGAT